MSNKITVVFGLAVMVSASTFALSTARGGPLDFNFDLRETTPITKSSTACSCALPVAWHSR
jgi:hypothetical protein